MSDEQFTVLITALTRLVDSLQRNTESNAALFGLLVSGSEAEPQAAEPTIPQTLD